MRFGAAVALALTSVIASTGCSSGLFRQYEYEEDVYLSLDGSATVYVNGSLAALDALCGARFDTAPTARFNRDEVREFFSTPVTHVVSISNSRRSNRRFAHVRLEVADIRRLSAAPPFAWSRYDFALDNGLFAYRQTIGAPTGSPLPDVHWSGDELVAFRLHLPSTVVDEPAGARHERGNILVWEQPLADRLAGRPLVLSARIETESILAHTLLLFGATACAALAALGLLVWWIARRGAHPAHV